MCSHTRALREHNLNEPIFVKEEEEEASISFKSISSMDFGKLRITNIYVKDLIAESIMKSWSLKKKL